MAYQDIDLGLSAGDGTGDTIREGGDKLNDNFVEIYTKLGTGTVLTSGISADATVVTLTSPIIAETAKFAAGGAADAPVITRTNDTNTGIFFSAADALSVTTGGTLRTTVNSTGLAVTGNVTATGTVEPAGDTAAGDLAAIGRTAAEGLILTGQGSTSDITLKNDADATVFTVPTGTDDILFPDNAKILLGAGSDLQIFHDGSNSNIKDAGTGNLFLDSVAGSVIIRVNTNENAIEAIGDGAVNISHNGSTKIATASGGVNVTGGIGLGGTGAANILNDYEEGTFTPTFKNSGGVEVDAYSIQTGFYTKVGRLVHVRGFVVVNGISNLGSSNPIFLGGLPFDSENLTNGHSVGTFNYGQGLNITAGHVVAGHLGNNTTNVNLTVWNVSTGVGDFTFGLLSGDGGIMFSIHYHVA